MHLTLKKSYLFEILVSSDIILVAGTARKINFCLLKCFLLCFENNVIICLPEPKAFIIAFQLKIKELKTIHIPCQIYQGDSHLGISPIFVRIRAGSVADFSFRYPASVKPYRLRDTERTNCVLAYPQSNRPTNRK